MANVKLRALREHENEFGVSYAKAKGDEYEAPEGAAQSLIANGLCAEVKPAKADAKPA